MVTIEGLDHIGIRVADSARAEGFYALLGFQVVARHPPAKVVILKNAAGVEINLIVNADRPDGAPNVLQDVPEKYPGYTHVALTVASMKETVAELGRLGIAISEGPVRLGDGQSLFVRDPDRNVVELRSRGE